MPSLINIKLTYYLIAELSRALSARSERSWVGEFQEFWFCQIRTYVRPLHLGGCEMCNLLALFKMCLTRDWTSML